MKISSILQRKDYIQGSPICLFSCCTGDDKSGTCFAKQLSKIINAEVIAPEQILELDF